MEHMSHWTEDVKLCKEHESEKYCFLFSNVRNPPFLTLKVIIEYFCWIYKRLDFINFPHRVPCEWSEGECETGYVEKHCFPVILRFDPGFIYPEWQENTETEREERHDEDEPFVASQVPLVFRNFHFHLLLVPKYRKRREKEPEAKDPVRCSTALFAPVNGIRRPNFAWHDIPWRNTIDRTGQEV